MLLYKLFIACLTKFYNNIYLRSFVKYIIFIKTASTLITIKIKKNAEMIMKIKPER